MGKHFIYCNCNFCVDRRNLLGENQTLSNRTIVVPSSAKSDYQLAIESGEIDPDTTLTEWLNRPPILFSPDGSKFFLKVDNAGVLSTEKIL